MARKTSQRSTVMHKKRTRKHFAGRDAIRKAMGSVVSPVKRVHVISHKAGWAVKSEGTSKAYKVYGRKESAIRGAKTLATKGSGRDVVIHKEDGTIQEWVKVQRSKNGK